MQGSDLGAIRCPVILLSIILTMTMQKATRRDGEGTDARYSAPMSSPYRLILPRPRGRQSGGSDPGVLTCGGDPHRARTLQWTRGHFSYTSLTFIPIWRTIEHRVAQIAERVPLIPPRLSALTRLTRPGQPQPPLSATLMISQRPFTFLVRGLLSFALPGQ